MKVDKIVVKKFYVYCGKMFHRSASSYVGFKGTGQRDGSDRIRLIP